MNAKWLEKLVEYRNTENGLTLSKAIIHQKIYYQFTVIQKRKEATRFLDEIKLVKNNQDLMLVEARAAKKYWQYLGEKIKNKIRWSGRMPHGKDVLNNLLDVGYHYLAQKVSKIFDEVDMPRDLGLLHKAQSKNAKPLVYDFMEWLRPIIDDVLIKFLRKKKKFVEEVSNKDIAHFLFLVKEVFARDLYHKKFKYCISLEYWTKLIALEMRGAISENREAGFYFPSLRHENRCNKKPAHTERVISRV